MVFVYVREDAVGKLGSPGLDQWLEIGDFGADIQVDNPL